MMDDDDETSNITPKQALMGWVKSKLPPEVTFIGCKKVKLELFYILQYFYFLVIKVQQMCPEWAKLWIVKFGQSSIINNACFFCKILIIFNLK